MSTGQYGVDPVGRSLISFFHLGQNPMRAPDLIVLSPEKALLGRLPFDARAETTLDFLQGILASHPELASGPTAEIVYQNEDPAQRQFAKIEARWQAGERAELIESLEQWLNIHGNQWTHGDASVLYMLGVGYYHKGQLEQAAEYWRTVQEQYPNHPLRHRALYNQLDPKNWPMPLHRDIRQASQSTDKRISSIHVPNPTLRNHHLSMVKQHSRYRQFTKEMPMVLIPRGTFTMGGQPAYFARELPLRTVHISRSFWMSAWPVTRADWSKFRPNDFPISDSLAAALPVAVSFEEASDYCQFLSDVSGLPYRLPTEAEWEYAARGGLEGMPYPWGDEPVDESRCNFKWSEGVPVGSYAPNGYGLFEMVGNVAEWCQDDYLENAYALTDAVVTDPLVKTNSKTLRTARGGFPGVSFNRYWCRNALRLSGPIKAGIRLVLPHDESLRELTSFNV